MCEQLIRVGVHDHQLQALAIEGLNTGIAVVRTAGTRVHIQRQGTLAAGHRQVDIRKYLGVEQSPMLVAATVVDIVATAQRIE